MRDKEREVIQNYINEECNKNKELASRVEMAGDYFKGLERYIRKQASEYLKGKDGMVADSLVFNWVFDYFHDSEYENEPKTMAEKVEKIVNTPAPTFDTAPIKKKKNDEAEGQVSLW